MNPTGRKTAKDGAKFRQQYLANLALEASNIQTNTNANLIYKETGASPTKSTDPRNATERYAGLEGKKQLMRDELSGANIMTTHVAEDVIQELREPEIDFFTQYREFIMKDFKPKNVPAKVFIDYLRRLIHKTNLTKGVEYGLQQTTGNGILINSQLALATSITPEFVRRQVETLQRSGDVPAHVITEVENRLDKLTRLATTPEEAAQLNTILESQAASKGVAIMELMSEIAEYIPARDEIEAEIDELVRSRGENRGGFYGLFDGVDAAARASSEMRDELNATARSSVASLGKDAVFAPPSDAPIWGAPEPDEGDISSSDEEAKEQGELQEEKGEYADTSGPPLNDDSRQDILDSLPEREAQLFEKFRASSLAVKKQILQNERANPREIAASQGGVNDTPIKDLFLLLLANRNGVRVRGNGLRGCGLKKRRQKTAVDRSEGGYTKPKAYKQFGRYMLNHHKLDDGILMIKAPSGAAIAKIPSERISHNMVKAVKSIGSGLSPSLEDFNSLSETEKKKLHHISTHSRVAHNIPNPKLNDDEADLNRFNILRGELVAGNDSSALKKEFKALMMKFMKEGRLPRQQVNEILAELL